MLKWRYVSIYKECLCFNVAFLPPLLQRDPRSTEYVHVLVSIALIPDCDKGAAESNQARRQERQTPIRRQRVSSQRLHLELWRLPAGEERARGPGSVTSACGSMLNLFVQSNVSLKDLGEPKPHGQRHPVLWR